MVADHIGISALILRKGVGHLIPWLSMRAIEDKVVCEHLHVPTLPLGTLVETQTKPFI